MDHVWRGGGVFRKCVTRSDGGRLGMSEGWSFERLKASLCKTLVPSKGDLFARIESNIPTLSRNALTYSLPMTSVVFPGRSPHPPKIVELPCVIALAILAIYF